MTGAEKLRKENQALRNEIEELKTKLQKVSDDLSKNQHGRHGKRELSPDEAHSLEFISGQYDDFIRFKEEADKQIRELISRVTQISTLCDYIRKSIEASEAYSYQFNIKIVGVPTVAERETNQQTADLCMKLFAALRVEGVSLNDIDTAHRVPSRVASNRPNAIICKFVRRLTREKVMAARRRVSNLNADDLGFNDAVAYKSYQLIRSPHTKDARAII